MFGNREDWEDENGIDVEDDYEAEMRAEYKADMLATMPSPAEIAQWEADRERYRISHHQYERAKREMAQYHVNWLDITLADVMTLSQALDKAQVEEDVQRFLTDNKQFLIQHLGGGHGRYVLPKPKLGKDLVPDYLLAEMDSEGIHWHGVELESPSTPMFTAKGEPTARLTHAIQQVRDWREWLKHNIDQANRPDSEDGLGLVGIDGNLPATILVGRRKSYPPKFNAYRRQTTQDSNIAIHSYDWLIDQAQSRATSLREYRRRQHA